MVLTEGEEKSKEFMPEEKKARMKVNTKADLKETG